MIIDVPTLYILVVRAVCLLVVRTFEEAVSICEAPPGLDCGIDHLDPFGIWSHQLWPWLLVITGHKW